MPRAAKQDVNPLPFKDVAQREGGGRRVVRGLWRGPGGARRGPGASGVRPGAAAATTAPAPAQRRGPGAAAPPASPPGVGRRGHAMDSEQEKQKVGAPAPNSPFSSLYQKKIEQHRECAPTAAHPAGSQNEPLQQGRKPGKSCVTLAF